MRPGTRQRRGLLLPLLVLGCVGYVSLIGRGVGVADAQGKKRIQWEYAELVSGSYGGNRTLVLTKPTDVVRAKSYKELCTKLGKKADRNDPTSVLNILGAEGWELVSQTYFFRDQNNYELGWTFKRPR